MTDIKESLKQINIKLHALEIILTAPLWPKRYNLNGYWRDLLDQIINEAKPYALLVAKEEYLEALKLIGGWSPLVDAFIDNTLIQDTDRIKRMANLRLLKVYQHYAKSGGISFEEIK